MGVGDRLGYELSKVGERFGSSRLTYNRVIMRMYDRLASTDAPLVAPALCDAFPDAVTFLDVGAGSGAYAAELLRRGRRVTALERSPRGRALAAEKSVSALSFDLNRTPPASDVQRHDVAYCFELAEHLPASSAGVLVRFLHEHADRIVLTAAPPGQGGTGHVNEQPASYWTGLFDDVGRRRRDEVPFTHRLQLDRLNEHWRLTNIMCF